MLGHKMVQALDDVTGTIRGATPHPVLAAKYIVSMVDVRNWRITQEVIDAVRPDAVVNCVGIIKQRQPQVTDAIAVNALFPHQLAEHCRERGNRLIHISTDCVFDGRQGGHTEADPPNATDIYGRSKALGELSDNDHVLTLRTSLIGRELTGSRSLLEWFLAQSEPVDGYALAFFSGVTTNRLAVTICKLLTDHPDLSGLYNVASQRISKHNLLTLVATIYGRPKPYMRAGVVVADRSLDGSAFTAATGIETPAWPAMLTAMAADPTPYEDWR
jgi:dTDP-4-dehydrorhamnose reductase